MWIFGLVMMSLGGWILGTAIEKRSTKYGVVGYVLATLGGVLAGTGI